MDITVEEAIQTMINYPCKEDFILWKVKHSMNGGELTDNSIELAQYWEQCRKIVLKQPL
jgi:hypothetical protein